MLRVIKYSDAQFLKGILHLQVIIKYYIPCVIQYILVAYFIPNSFCLLISYPYTAHLLYPLPTDTTSLLSIFVSLLPFCYSIVAVCFRIHI